MAIHANLGPSFPGSHTLIQLVNKDGDCYINSILQALYNLRPTQNYCWACQQVFESDGLTERAEQSLFGFLCASMSNPFELHKTKFGLNRTMS
jgi:hypothetical protein